ncbi:myb-like protein Q [Condylostylus longicornis]|uniref:myb-like protein Q n=1 Tax=Condylostylus longicornis TaxID=2530218 RepID=UPI00244E12B6|nr:myb-like protein Q [Condylostylus longicornis]
MVPQHTQDTSVTPPSPTIANGGLNTNIILNNTNNGNNNNNNNTFNMGPQHQQQIEQHQMQLQHQQNLQHQQESQQQQQLQQQQQQQRLIPNNLSGVIFGSQLVDINSSTPYSDATQVRFQYLLFFSQFFYGIPSIIWE